MRGLARTSALFGLTATLMFAPGCNALSGVSELGLVDDAATSAPLPKDGGSSEAAAADIAAATYRRSIKLTSNFGRTRTTPVLVVLDRSFEYAHARPNSEARARAAGSTSSAPAGAAADTAAQAAQTAGWAAPAEGVPAPARRTAARAAARSVSSAGTSA